MPQRYRNLFPVIPAIGRLMAFLGAFLVGYFAVQAALWFGLFTPPEARHEPDVCYFPYIPAAQTREPKHHLTQKRPLKAEYRGIKEKRGEAWAVFSLVNNSDQPIRFVFGPEKRTLRCQLSEKTGYYWEYTVPKCKLPKKRLQPSESVVLWVPVNIDSMGFSVYFQYYVGADDHPLPAVIKIDRAKIDNL